MPRSSAWSSRRPGGRPASFASSTSPDGVVAHLTLTVDGTTPLADAHAQASHVEGRIRREQPEIGDIIVHTEPDLKLCMFSPKGKHLQRGWPGRIEGDRVIQLAAQTLQSFFTGGGTAREHAEFRLDEVDFRPPVLHPPSVRDFYAFEQHVKTARANRGLEVPPEWYEMPVFYFSNPAAIYGPEDEVPYPEARRSSTTSSRSPRSSAPRAGRRVHDA